MAVPFAIRVVPDIDPFALPAGVLLPGLDLAAFRHEAALLAPDHVDFAAGTLLLAVRSFLLRLGGRTILIDTCVGEGKPRPRRPDWHDRRGTGYPAALAAAGVRPEEVDFVLCTHLHADHVGWNTKAEGGRWVPTFPNARYLASAAEIAHWDARDRAEPGLHSHGAFADSVRPLIEAGRLDAVADGFEPVPGAAIRPLPGHSPGQVGLALRGNPGAVFCGDAIHSPVQVLHPGLSSAFCSDPAEAAATRRALLDEAAETGTLLLPAHVRGRPALRVRRAGTGFRPDFVELSP